MFQAGVHQLLLPLARLPWPLIDRLDSRATTRSGHGPTSKLPSAPACLACNAVYDGGPYDSATSPSAPVERPVFVSSPPDAWITPRSLHLLVLKVALLLRLQRYQSNADRVIDGDDV